MFRRQSIPNLLTFARVAAVPVCLYLVCFAANGSFALFWIFIAASLTDFFDGYLARKWNAVTPLGTFLDPVADKLLVALMLLYVLQRFGSMLLLPVIVIILREIYISGLREFLAAKGAKLPVSKGGKLKTALQMLAIAMLLGHLAYNPPGEIHFPCSILRDPQGALITSCIQQPILLRIAEHAGTPMLQLAALIALLTAVHYTWLARKSFK